MKIDIDQITPENNDLGFVLGLDAHYARNSKFGTLFVRLEGGKYPVANDFQGWSGMVNLGYRVYFVTK